MTKQATSTPRIDNHRTRVTEWRFAPGEATGVHRRHLDYLIVPLTGGTLRLVNADGTQTTAELTPGHAYFRDAGIEHNVFNAGTGEIVFLETEFK